MTFSRLLRLAAAGLVAVGVALAVAPQAVAQYFGRNKVQYERFNFRVFETDHFKIYYYPEAEVAARDAARMAERWYERHRRTYLNTFGDKKALVFYADDADFQQTNVISGQIGEGTGGVTEGLKQRVTMPFTGSYAENDHVLGHELVHSFQYDLALTKDTTGFNLQGLPLWLIEGTAEYLSVGRQDPHTAMWLRDAALRDDIPTISKLTRDTRYFPYRYGQAVMAYVGGKYGDAAVANLYRMAGRVGADSAFVFALGISADSLSREWAAAVRNTYLPLTVGRTPAAEVGRTVLTRGRSGGRMNVAPSLSPDGSRLAFLSDSDLFNINLFVADAETGRVTKRVRETAGNAHFDAIRFIASSGTWSPDGRRLAFVTFVEGDNEISIFDVSSQRVVDRFRVASVGSINNPSWSPDGTKIAFTGLKGGLSDLYVLDLASKQARQLTDDRYADLQPTWSPDGQTLAFVTDRGPEGTNFETLEYAEMRLGLYRLTSGQIDVIRPFGRAMHHNPQFSRDGQSLFFISDQDGFRDVYRTDLASGQVFRVTNLQTGVSGITSLSPAMTVARQTGRMAFSVFSNNGYTVHTFSEAETVGTPLIPRESGIATAGVLPPVTAISSGLVATYLRDPGSDLPTPYAQEGRPYRAALRLDAVAPPTVGASVGGYYGAGVQGGVGFLFSDMLGNHQLVAVAQANGTFKDIGGQVQYLNMARRLNWGLSAAHIPVQYYAGEGVLASGEYAVLRDRIFITQGAALAAYPLSTTRRFEADLGVTRYGFSREADIYAYDAAGNFVPVDRRKFDAPDPVYLGRTGIAYVTDFSNFAFTSPVQGGRSRFQITANYINDTQYVDSLGTRRFVTALADVRRYFFKKPFTFAVRGLHIGNYGLQRQSSSRSFADRIGTEYLGSPYYLGFVRGYNFSTFTDCKNQVNDCYLDDLQLVGSRIALASAELRIPLIGTRDFGLIKFPFLPTELAVFADAGLAWDKSSTVRLKFERDPVQRILDTINPNAVGPTVSTYEDLRYPMVSVGASARVNVLGYLVAEIFYAYPFQRPERGAHFGFNLQPGW